MLDAAPYVLAVPLVLWGATGLAIVGAYRGSTPRVLLRLAAAFLGLWALVASTALLWVIGHGGLPAVVALLRDPALLIAPASADAWLVGGAVALILLSAAFLVNQAVGHGLLRLLRPTPQPWPEGLAPPVPGAFLGRFRSERADAFGFTLAEIGPGGRPRRREVVLVSDGLWGRLTPEERRAVIAHELGHLDALDGRYLTFVRTSARILRWDPFFALLARSLTRREELRADRRAVERTGDPAALARALGKAAAADRSGLGLPGSGGLLGGRSGRRSPGLLEERLRRLRGDGTAPERPAPSRGDA